MQYPTIAQPQYGFAPTMPMMPSMSDMPPAMMAEGGSVADAQSVQSKGRGRDTMLVHMTPKEVGGLQALAMQQGGSLTINPQTGLPEAGFLENMLPTLLGVGGMFLGIPPHITAMAVGGIQTARTGDIGQGLLAGLGAYGGANLAGSLGAAGASTAASATPGVTEAVASGTLPQASMSVAPTSVSSFPFSETGAQFAPTVAAPTIAPTAGQSLLQASTAPAGTAGTGSLLAANPVTAATTMGATLPTGATAAGEGFRALGTEAGRDAFMSDIGGYTGLAKQAGMAAAPALFAPPPAYKPPGEEESDYAGPYTPSARRVSYPGDDERRRSSEFMYFTPSNPVPFAEGGEAATSATTSPDVFVSPNEARAYQDIMNVQRLAGLPAIDPNRFSVMPGRSYEEFVYNPIESDGGVPALGTGEENFKFKPLLSKEAIAKAEKAEKEKSIFSRLFGKGGGYATGGHVSVPTLENGGFVLTKKAVDGLGRGNNEKGQANAQRGLGAIPIRGAGAKRGPKAGVDDKIKTSIDGKRPALVSNGEAYVPKKQVARKGGAKAFYALMKQAEKAADKRRRA